MQTSETIAAILGPVMFAVAILESVHARIWKDVPPAMTFLNGMILMTGGLTVLVFHSGWAADWTALVTLSGWALLIAGLARMAFPDAVRTDTPAVMYPVTAGVALIGLVLAVQGWL